MPFYDVYCEECEFEMQIRAPIAERNDQPCPHCRRMMRTFLKRGPAVVLFKPHSHPSLDDMYFTSKRQLIEECKRRQVADPRYMSP
jgi:hypothetical protein